MKTLLALLIGLMMLFPVLGADTNMAQSAPEAPPLKTTLPQMTPRSMIAQPPSEGLKFTLKEAEAYALKNHPQIRLRMGVHTGICDIGTFRSDLDWYCALIGPETELAAKVAATAAMGSIAISPETYALVKDDIHADTSGCLLMEEFHDSDLAQVCLTPAPAKRTEHAPSTFAGLGRF